jgi:peptide/nickel transport system permease protein
MAVGAFPAYFTALLIMYFLGLKLGWFPIQHAYGNDVTPGLNGPFLVSAVDHGFMPALVIVLAFAGGWVLNMRSVMINTISEDYVAMAHAKGLKDRRVMTRYAARNAILPPLNGFAPQFATAVGGVVFVELVFSYPGAGLTLQQAALGKDLPLTQALLLFFTICPIVAIFLIDLVNFALDPRIRAS